MNYFICNMLDPRVPGNIEKMISPNAIEEKKEFLKKYIEAYLSKFTIGKPMETYSYTFAQLKEMQIVGIYSDKANNEPVPFDADVFKHSKDEVGEIIELKQKTRKHIYKVRDVFEKHEVNTIDDYNESSKFSSDTL